ncbi:hypothetical protein D9M68_584350 [compost metagenome]
MDVGRRRQRSRRDRHPGLARCGREPDRHRTGLRPGPLREHRRHRAQGPPPRGRDRHQVRPGVAHAAGHALLRGRRPPGVPLPRARLDLPRMRREPEAPADRLHRPVHHALAGSHDARGRDHGRAAGAQEAGKDPRHRREQRDARDSFGVPEARPGRCGAGALQPHRPRHRDHAGAAVRRAQRGGAGLFVAGAGPAGRAHRPRA